MADEKETETAPDSPDVHFEPVVKLDPVETVTLEEEEDVLLKIRARLFRYDTEADPKEWKERGVGECRILKHKHTGQIRFLMRRDKTLKICANHYIYPEMELIPKCGSDRTWIWKTLSDFADEESKEEVLAIQFGNAEKAQTFKTGFEEAGAEMEKLRGANPIVQNGKESSENGDEDERPEADQDELTSQLKELKVEESKSDDSQSKESSKDEDKGTEEKEKSKE